MVELIGPKQPKDLGLSTSTIKSKLNRGEELDTKTSVQTSRD